MFGGSDTVDVQMLGTFSDRALVLNSQGQCFQALLAEDKGNVVFSGVEPQEMPVYSAQDVAVEAKNVARAAVDAMLSEGAEAASGSLDELVRLVTSGVSVTGWSHCRDIREWLGHSQGWRQALIESDNAVGALLSSQSETLTIDYPRELQTECAYGSPHQWLCEFYSQLRESVTAWHTHLAPLCGECFPDTFGEFLTDLTEDVAALDEIQSNLSEFLEAPQISAHLDELVTVTEQLAEQLPLVSRGVEFVAAFVRRSQEKEQVG